MFHAQTACSSGCISAFVISHQTRSQAERQELLVNHLEAVEIRDFCICGTFAFVIRACFGEPYSAKQLC
jgi:hypothetical protein